MDKIYLLLRNNQQTGPHTLEELMQSGLKPNDLIWIEEQSHCWSDPSEIEALKKHMDEANIAGAETTGKQSKPVVFFQPHQVSGNQADTVNAIPVQHIHVRLPAHFVQQPTTVSKILSDQSQPQEIIQSKDNTSEEKTALSEKISAEEYPALLYGKRISNKKKVFERSGIIVLAVMLLLGAGYKLTKGAGNKEATTLTVKDNLKKQTPPPVKDIVAVNETGPIVPATEEVTIKQTLPVTDKPVLQPTVHEPVVSPTKKNIITPAAEVTKNPPAPIIPDTKKEEQEPVTQAADRSFNTTTEVKEISTPTVPEEKKKTLTEKISSLFKFKMNKKEPANASPAAEVINLKDQVEVTYHLPYRTASDQHLEFTLYNRSNKVVTAADVEVRYYNQQNGLLDKKIIHFNNVPPGKSATVTAPYLSADHTYYQLLSAIN